MGKYYRFMKDVGAKENLPGIEGIAVSRFRKGDYLESHDGGRIFLHLRLKEQEMLADLHEDVQRVVSADVFQSFLEEGCVVEVPQNIRELDLLLQREEAALVRRFSDAFSVVHSAATSDTSGKNVDFSKGEHMKLYEACKAVKDKIEHEVEEPLHRKNLARIAISRFASDGAWLDEDDLEELDEVRPDLLDAISYYLHGNCENWVLENFQPGDIAVVWNEFDDDIGKVALVHCYIQRGEAFLDVRGETDDEELVEEGFDYGYEHGKVYCETLEEYKKVIRDICGFDDEKWAAGLDRVIEDAREQATHKGYCDGASKSEIGL